MIFALIIILPVFKELRLIVYGERVEGMHLGYSYVPALGAKFNQEKVPRTVIKYMKDGRVITLYAYEHIPYEAGDSIPLIIDRWNEKKYLITSFKGLVVRPEGILVLLVMSVWTAIFLTLAQSRKSKESQ